MNWIFKIDFLSLFICQFPNSDPLPLLIIICLYLSYRIVFTFTITILTLKTALMVAFIVDFNRMTGVKLVRYLILSKFKNKKSKIKILDYSGYSDTLILRSSFVVSFLITSAIVGLEFAWKLAFQQNLVGASHTFVYMGMQVCTLSMWEAILDQHG